MIAMLLIMDIKGLFPRNLDDMPVHPSIELGFVQRSRSGLHSHLLLHFLRDFHYSLLNHLLNSQNPAQGFQEKTELGRKVFVLFVVPHSGDDSSVGASLLVLYLWLRAQQGKQVIL
jgi:hypothetical protein